MHSRRYFVKARDAGDKRAALPLAAFRRLDKIEDEILDLDAKLVERQARSTPGWDQLGRIRLVDLPGLMPARWQRIVLRPPPPSRRAEPDNACHECSALERGHGFPPDSPSAHAHPRKMAVHERLNVQAEHEPGRLQSSG
jgi:hypothetical protein